MTKHILFAVLLGLALLNFERAHAQAPQVLGVRPMPPGVRGDGVTDDTNAIQVLLDQAGKTGGEVFLPSGKYLLRGSLRVPSGVSLQGSWRAPHHGAWQSGSTFLVVGGRGQENGTPTITLAQSSSVRGFTMLWPEQKWPDIVPYPYAIHGTGMHPTVEDVTFSNAYQGIKIGRPWSELHLIRNVFGCVLRRGILVDETSDIGRLENIHFNPHYWPRSNHPSSNGAKDMDVARYMADNLEAFIFGRSDWEYVANCFVFAAKVGYRFIETPAGACNAQLLNIGADFCRVGLQIDKIQKIGIQVTNGAFTSFAGEPNVGILTSPGAVGAAQFVNCNFWATPGGAARLDGSVSVAFSDCHFLDVPDLDAKHAAITSSAGRLNVRGSTFGKPGRALWLRRGVSAAIASANLQAGGFSVQNDIGRRAQVALNEEASRPESASYRLKMGAGDEDFVRGGWHASEPVVIAPNAPNAPPGSAAFSGARWSQGAGRVSLPIEDGQIYTVRVLLSLAPNQPPQTVAIEGGPSIETSRAGPAWVELKVPAAMTKGKQSLSLVVRGQPWKPSVLQPPSKDARDLGAYVFGVEVIAPGVRVQDAN